MGPTKGPNLIIIRILLLWFTISTCFHINRGADSDDDSSIVRFKRQSGPGGTSILTVEWEGIHSKVSDDRTIGGFRVEYRPESDRNWIQHDGIIPYQGPNMQYRVRIRDLPSGVVYYVRIKVLGRNNEELVETPEIKAQTELVKIVCSPGQTTEPRNVRIVTSDMHTLTFEWDPPQCGSILNYVFIVEGFDDYARYDVQTQTVDINRATVRNLLPGTSYTFRVRAVDNSRQEGPWTDTVIRGLTEGSAPIVSNDIKSVYRTDKQIRVEWEPYRDRQLQHYEVMISEETNNREGFQVFRSQVSASENGYVFTNLKPSTNYHIAVIAFADFHPRQVYRMNEQTAKSGAQVWSVTPSVTSKGVGKVAVYWEQPTQFPAGDLKGFIIEFRLPNETIWRRYGNVIEYRPGQKDYTTEISGLNDKIVYAIRVYLVNQRGEVVAVTDEFNVGSTSVTSCMGPAGMPQNVQAFYVGDTSITYLWDRPTCDESYGPVEGFEYLFWNLDRGKEPERPIFVTGHKVTLDKLTPSHRYALRVRSRSKGGHSPWSEPLKATTKAGGDGGRTGNIYDLRIVVGSSTAKSYLVWTPLAEHRNQIDRIRLSYKISTTEHWEVIEDRPTSFACPSEPEYSQHIKPGDFCYDLSGLQYDIQYTGDVVYRLNNGEWSRKGNPLFFILIVVDVLKPGPAKTPDSPTMLTILFKTETVADVSWLPPLSELKIDEYKITVRVLSSQNTNVVPGSVNIFRTPGNVYKQTVENILPDTIYNISVEAGSQGTFGPAVWELVSAVPQGVPEIREPRVQQRGETTSVGWDVAGQVQRLCCYQIDVRSDSDPEWRPHGSEVGHQRDLRTYTNDMRGLLGNTRYFVRIRGLGNDRSTLCTSPSVSFTTQCEAPRSPPDNIEIRSSDPRTVVLTWNHPDKSTWGCTEIWYNVEGTSNNQPQRFQVRSDPRGFRVEYRIQTDPGADLRLRVQTANSGGVSPWSQEYSIRTDTEAYVSTPSLNPQGTQIRVDWTSQGQGTGIVYGYIIEYRTDQDPRWQRQGSLIPYRGDNIPYTGAISGLPVGGRTYVRILVLDRNQRVIYTSPEATAETTCTAPSLPPSNVQIDAPDPRHVRIQWEPPPLDASQCSDITYELQVIEPPNVQPVRLHGNQNTQVFDARPNQRWSIQIRAVNSAGHSPWSRVVNTVTSPPGELIEGLTVVYQQQVPVLSWRSVHGVDELVAAYRVEIQHDYDQSWRPHSSGMIRFIGSQRPYSVQLVDLPDGRTVQARVIVIDQNNGIAYTSPGVPIQVPSRCRAPVTPPTGLRAQALGTNEMRVTWTPVSQSEWNCDRMWYIVKYSGDRTQGYKNFSAFENSATFESEPSSRWTFQIQSGNQAGNSPWSAEVHGQTEVGAPGQISNLRIVPIGPDTVQLTWDPPANARDRISNYDIVYQLLSRGMCADTPEREITVQSRTPVYTLQGLHPHSRYRITIRAKTNVPGEAVTQEVTTPASAPIAPPRAVQVQDAQSRRFTINWQAPPCLQTNGEVREYEYEATGVDPWAAREQYRNRIGDTRASVDGLTPFTKYRVKVRAWTSQGSGPWSQEIIASTTSSEEPPSPPNLRVVDAQPNSIQLMWQSPYPPHADIDRYKVQFAISGSGRWNEREFRLDQLYCSPEVQRSQRNQPGTGGNSYCITVSGLEPDQMYDFQVASHAVGGRRYGPWSNTETARTGAGPVRVLNIQQLRSTDNSLEVSWTVGPSDQSRVRGFRIMVHPLRDHQRMQQYTVDGSVYQYHLEGLTPNTQYNVTIQARTDSGFHDGTSKTMTTEDSRITGIEYPPTIIDKKADSVTVQWSVPRDPGSIAGYMVEFKVPPRGDWAQHGQMVPHIIRKPSYQHVITGLSPNSDVMARIRAVGKNNIRGDPSPEATGRTECMAPSLPPQVIKIDPVCAPGQSPNVLITWQRPVETTWRCDQISYEIAYFTEKQPLEQTVRVTGTQSEYSFPSAPFTKWNVKIRTVNKVGHSQWSLPVEAITCEGEPGRIRNLVVTPLSPNEVRVAWNPPIEKTGRIEGYDISYRLKHRLACPNEEPRDVSRTWITRYNVENLAYVLTGLLPYSEYEVKVRARGTLLGAEEMRVVQTHQQPPSAPPLDLKSGYVLERSLGFTWDPVECSQRHGHITTYEYELLGQDGWAKLEVRIANTSMPKVDIDGLTPFTKYIMRVKAYNSAGGGPATADLEVMTGKAAAPLSPQDLSVMVEGIDFITVSWLPPYPPYGPIDQYRIRYAKDPRTPRPEGPQWVTPFEGINKNDPRLHCPGTGPENPRFCFNITRLDPGSPYRIQASAKIEGGSYGPWSQSVTANTLTPAPDTVKSITLIGKSTSSLHISWVPPDDPHRTISTYKVCAEPTTNRVPPKCFIVNHPTNDYEIPGLNPETAYLITVQVGSKGVFGPKVSTTYMTDASAPNPLTTAPIISDKGPSHLTVEWTGIPDPQNRVQGYTMEYRRLEDPTWAEFGGVVRHDNLKRTYMERITGLNPDTSYVVRIKVLYKDNKISDPSPQAEARTGCQAPSAAPSNFAVQAPFANEVRSTWRPPPSHSWQCSNIKYRIEYRNGTGGPVQYLEMPGTGTEHTFTSQPYTQWTLRIRTENPAGHSPWSDEIVVTTPPGIPGPVGNLAGEGAGSDRIKVTWDPPKNPNGIIEGYIITYQLKSKADCPIPLSQPITKLVHGEKHLIKELEPASTYEVIVRAKTTVEGPPSDPILVKTDEAIPTGPPTSVAAAAIHKSSLTFTWEEPICEHRNGEITKYEYQLTGMDPWAQGDSKKGSTTTERLELQNLTPFTHYQFQVRAVNSKGAGPWASPLVVITKPGAPPAPTDVQADELSSTATALSFLPPAPPNGILDEYRIRYTPSDRISWQEHRKTPDELVCSGNRPERLCYRVTELEPLKQYIVQIAGHTRDGDWGDWSHSNMFTTTDPDIPTPERPLHVTDVKSDSVTVVWEGLPANQLKNVQGYVLEVNNGGTSDWVQYQDVVLVKGSHGGQIFSEIVRNLKPDTMYFFRLKVADKKGRRGHPGPEERARTLCGKPSQPPKNIKISTPAYNSVRATFEPPPQDSWKCRRAVYVLKYQNDSSSGQIDIEPTAGNQYEFTSQPGRKWSIEMKTQAVNDNGDKGESSDWSNAQTISTPGLPDRIDLECAQLSHDQAQCSWELPSEDGDWRHGVDVTYQLKQRGNCPQKYYPPVTEYNVQSRKHLLQKLDPYSLYTVTVTPRVPSHLDVPGMRPPSSTSDVRTNEKEPDGPPLNVRSQDVSDKSVIMQWQPPECDKQNGEISMYEYSMVGVDDWAKNEVRQASTQRLRANIKDLQPGTLYRFKVRAYTSAGPGPFSEPIDVRTTGSGIGAPREVNPFDLRPRQVAVTWLPPANARGAIEAYKIRYGHGDEVTLRLDELQCNRYQNAYIVPESLCHLLTGLSPKTTYDIEVQARSSTGLWGPWTTPVYVTTPMDLPAGDGSLRAVHTDSESIKVRWDPPPAAQPEINYYLVNIYDTNDRTNLKRQNLTNNIQEYNFRGLKSNNPYNVTVEGGNGGRLVWFITRIFKTHEKGETCSDAMEAPSNMMIVDKTDGQMRISWSPPYVLDDNFVHEYQVNISHFDLGSGQSSPVETFTVKHPSNQVNFLQLQPSSVYNISIQAFSQTQPSCNVLWGTWSTLDPPGRPHILKLRRKTPKTLHVYWTPHWGSQSGGYILEANPLWTQSGSLPGSVRDEVDPQKTDHIFRKLKPSTMYNVTLTPRNQGVVSAWGVYSTLPYGALLVSDLSVCDETQYAFSLSWEPIDDVTATHYQVRYAKVGSNSWIESPHKSHQDLRCPGVPVDCNKMCFLVFNLDGQLSSYKVQVRTMVEGDWNNWKTIIYTPSNPMIVSSKYSPCCIVPPYYMVDYIGDPATFWDVWIKPVPNDTHVKRYFVLVDERDPPGPIDETQIFDKITAYRKGLKYYITGALDRRTLNNPDGENFRIGDGKVIGGFLNYPLQKGKKYNWAFLTVWDVDGKPVIGFYRDTDDNDYVDPRFRDHPSLTTPSGKKQFEIIRGKQPWIGKKEKDPNDYVTSTYIGYWPWWWLLLFLLLLLLLILLLCCLCWCLAGRYRSRRKAVMTTRTDIMNGEKVPLVQQSGYYADVGKQRYRDDVGDSDMKKNLQNLESRLDNIKSQLETKILVGHAGQESRDGDRDSDSSYSHVGVHKSLHRSHHYITSKGDFEEGYVRGFRDANKVGTGTQARRRLDEDYGGMRQDFHSGYVIGLRDAGMQGMTTSMQHLAAARPRDMNGYSSGYMQGFQDGESGHYGKKLTTTLLNRLEQSYPNQPEFKQGYIDGFKDATAKGNGDPRLAESVNQLQDRLSTLERSRMQQSAAPASTAGDEIHTTKIYHVYNQLPEAGTGYQSTGVQLAHELEELSQSSKRSTLRRHYTPGDYLKYASDTEGAYGGESLTRRHRRSLSASNLGREESAFSPTIRSRNISDRQSSQQQQQYSDTFSRRYNYRTRSDIGSSTMPRRYPSQTLLDGVRPGPATSAHHREAVETLQRELGSISRNRTPVTTPTSGPSAAYRRAAADARASELARGYSSDTGYLYDTYRSGRQGGLGPVVPAPPPPLSMPPARDDFYDYDTYRYSSSQSHTRSEKHSYDLGGMSGVGPSAVGAITSTGTAGVSSATPLSSTPTRGVGVRNIPVHTATTASTSIPTAATHGVHASQGARSATVTSPVSSISSPDHSRPVRSSATSASATNQQREGLGVKQQQADSSLAQAYNLVGISADSSGSEADRGGAEGSWTDELMRIAQEPMPDTLERMKNYSASLSRLPPSPSPRRPAAYGAQRDSDTVRETLHESYDTHYKQEQSGAR